MSSSGMGSAKLIFAAAYVPWCYMHGPCLIDNMVDKLSDP